MSLYLREISYLLFLLSIMGGVGCSETLDSREFPKQKEDVNAINVEGLARMRTEHDRQSTNAQIRKLQAANLKRNVFLVDLLTFSPAEQTMVVTLQGLIADDPNDVIMVRSGGMSAILLEQFKDNGNRIVSIDSPWDLLYRFKDRIAGGILYQQGNDSINVATSLCGRLNSIAVTESLITHLKNVRIPILKDVREYDEKRAFKDFKHLYSKQYLIEQEENKHIYLRDFAVANNAFVYYGVDDQFRREIADYFGSDALIFGWGDDEYRWIRDISKNNQAAVPANWSRNLSVMQSMQMDIAKRPKRYPEPVKDGERIVAFVMTDGDNVQWMAGGFVSNYGFWANQHRGQFNMTWEIAPSMAEIASVGLNYFYKTASDGKFIDDFVAGPSGAAYCFPSLRSDKNDYAVATAELMSKSDLSIMTILDSGGSLESAKAFLEKDEVMGVLYKDFSPYNKHKGQIDWYKGKPAISYKYILWEPDAQNSPEGVARAIAKMPASPGTDSGSYALINVHAWSYGNDAGPLQSLGRPLGDIGGPMEAVRRTIDLLPADTRVVTAQELIILLRNNFGDPVWTLCYTR